MKKILYILFGLAFTNAGMAQCGTDEYNRKLVQDKLEPGENYIDYFEKQRDFEYGNGYNVKTKKAVRTIPVVFHIVHAYGAENISKAQIEDQMRIINEDFQRLNADASKTRAVFKDRAANMELEFKLARVAPDGSCTEGITRTYDPINTIEDYGDNDNEVKVSVRPWDRDKYLNIWVVSEILSSGTGTILGYAQFPGDDANTDGVVVIHDRIGTIGTASAADAGRTLTHEIGHWLGLYHPFQGGCTNNNNRTDRVDDTPPVSSASYGCTASQNPNTCSNDFPNEVDNVENFMDYANGGCMNMFTNGQKARVEGYLSSNTFRGRNIASSTILATGVNTNPNCGPIADFWYGQDKTTICAGQTISYDGMSYNAAITNRNWTFEGGTPGTSSVEDPTVRYDQPGVYKVALEVSNSEGSDKITRNLFVTVLPAISANKAPYSQDFSAATSAYDWELQTDISGNGWKRNTGLGYSGSQSLEMDIDASTPASTRYSAIMPPVDLTAYKAPISLHYKYAYARRVSTASEILLILASDDCGEGWRTIKAYNGDKLVTNSTPSAGWQPSQPEDWLSNSLDLSNYSESTNLFVRFDVISQSGNSVFLDDINIGEFALSIPAYESDFELSLVPNPAQNSVTLIMENVNDATVSIVDITGRLLLQQNLDHSNSELNTADLVNGVYSVLVYSEGKRWSKKLIISK
ncbi:M43 family zinc metalloprotease [Bacteroidia bacterium]|nr:M43 family zinc metalloprotease [Bacteroidia bacterium]MDB4107236.1 M43 family zinc metalloprotease [Bacteroidia bacterium]MDB9883151.1 M43 family zinc metalloprotease [Bacteroidia bacterium]